MNKLLQQMQAAMDQYLDSVVYVDEAVEKWDEAEHPRGKTTPESNSGSFTTKLWSGHAAGITSLISGASKLTAKEVQEGKHPLLRYEPKIAGTEHIVGQFTRTPDQPDPGYVKLSDAFFADGDELSRQLLLSHEFGHAIPAYLSQMSRWDEAFAVLAPFKSGGSGVYTRFDNFAGLSSNPEEMLADVYSSMLIYKKQPWEDEGRHADVYRYVLSLADEIGLPMPAWYVKKSWLESIR